MKDELILKISLILSIVGIIFLFLLSMLFSPKQIDLKNVQNYGNINVRFEGIVESVNEANGIFFVKVVQPEKSDLVVFNEGNLLLKEGDIVKVEAEIRDYNGEKQLVADKIEIVE